MVNNQASAGAAVYSKPVLSIYDLFVLGFSNQFCLEMSFTSYSRFLQRTCLRQTSGRGVGTGYFLDRCRFPSSTPTLARNLSPIRPALCLFWFPAFMKVGIRPPW